MKIRKKLFRLLQLAATVILLGYLIIRWGYSLNTLGNDLREPYWLLPCIFNAALITPLVAGWRWQTILRAVNIKTGLVELIKINFRAIFWGAILPSSDGFAFIRMAFVAHKYPEVKEKTIGSIVLEKYFGILILLATALIAGFFGEDIQVGNLRILLVILILVMLGLVAVVALLPKLKKPVEGNSLIKRVQRFVQILMKSWQEAHKGRLAGACIFILIVQLLSYLVIYCLFRLTGYELPILIHLSLIPVIQVISLLPFTIGGFGIREGAFIYFYQHLGVPAHTLITVSILNFVIQTGIPAVTGGIYSLLIQGTSPAEKV